MEIVKTNKKGQTLGGLGGGVLAIVVAIIVLILGVIILTAFRDLPMISQSLGGSFTNETVANLGHTPKNLVAAAQPGCVATLLFANNQTGTIKNLQLTNFTTSGCTVVFSGSAGDATINQSSINFTYSYTNGGVAYVAGNNSITGVSSFGGFIPMIVIALCASIIIGLILSGFAFRRQQR